MYTLWYGMYTETHQDQFCNFPCPPRFFAKPRRVLPLRQTLLCSRRGGQEVTETRCLTPSAFAAKKHDWNKTEVTKNHLTFFLLFLLLQTWPFSTRDVGTSHAIIILFGLGMLFKGYDSVWSCHLILVYCSFDVHNVLFHEFKNPGCEWKSITCLFIILGVCSKNRSDGASMGRENDCRCCRCLGFQNHPQLLVSMVENKQNWLWRVRWASWANGETFCRGLHKVGPCMSMQRLGGKSLALCSACGMGRDAGSVTAIQCRDQSTDLGGNKTIQIHGNCFCFFKLILAVHSLGC